MAQVLQWPLQQQGILEQGYGATTNGFEWPGHGQPHWHSGIDISWAGIRGAPILAAADGTVKVAASGCVEGDYACNTGWGNYIILQHTGAAAGLFTLYGHQTSFAVAQGDTVQQGQVIGYVGSTGNSTGPHLHFEVRNNGGGWGSDVNPGPYLSTGLATTLAPPLPQPPHAGSPGGAAGTDTTTGTDTLPPPLGADNSPVAIRAVSLAEVTARGGFPVAMLALGGAVLAVEDLTCTLPGYRHAGSWTATVPIESGAAVAAGPVQVIIFAGYAPRLPWTGGLAGLTPIFTGLLDGGADLDYDGATRQASLSGPDLSGLLSTESAAAPLLSALVGSGTGDTFANLTASAIARALATRHNLGFQGTDSGRPVGSYYGTDTVTARTAGQTEWDVLQQLAQAEGRVCYLSGTTLQFTKIPGAAQIVTLVHGTGRAGTPGQPPITRVRIRPQAHGGRTYRVVAQSYQTAGKSSATATVLSRDASGDNPDSTQVVTITEPPNRSADQLSRIAESALAVYQATETIVDIYAQGPVPVGLNQPIRLVSSEAPVPGLLYPVTREYSYQASEGLTCHLVCTTRPWAVLDSGTEGAVT